MTTLPAVVREGGQALTTPREAVGQALLEYQSPTAELIARPIARKTHYTIWLIAVMFAIALGVITLVPVNRVVNASGKVAAISGDLMVQPLEVSLVRAIHVREGQLVKAGDVLAELDPTFAAADAGSLEQQVASLQAEVDRLTAETRNQTYLSDGSPAGKLQETLFTQRHAEVSFKLENYNQQIASLRVKMEQAASDVKALTERLQLAQDVEAKRRELERFQVGSQLDRLQATDTRMQAQSQLADARSAEQGAQRDMEAEIADRDSFLKQTAADTAEQLTEQGRKLDDAREQLRKANLRRTLVKLRAARDAIVLHVAPVSVGTVMQSGDPFIELVPLDSPLKVDAVVDGEDVGFVRVGDPVSIKFNTFPYALYGTATGTVRSISPDSFTDPEAAPTKSADLQQPQGVVPTWFYRVQTSIDEVRLHDLPEGARIVPGMPVRADIVVGKRTILRYLMSRFIPPPAEEARQQ